MAKVTSKLQVTVPKQIADAYGIRPGDELVFERAGEAIRVWPARAAAADPAERLRRFDEATQRQKRRQRARKHTATRAGRGWTREELYERGRAR